MKELQAAARIRSRIDPPRLLVWGGNSLSGRLVHLQRLAGVDGRVLLVGVAANTMLRAVGGAVGRSAGDEDYLAGARTLREKLGSRLLLPKDFVTAPGLKATEGQIRPAGRVPETEMALDIGPETLALIEAEAKRAGTVIWCGTVGFHKAEPFAKGTQKLVETLAKTPAFTVVAGDDSVAAARATGGDLLDSIDCVARGGSATLALLNEKKLPGLMALRGTT
jgi:phosphoglycerate kinase